jgi:enediyne biosynthesis protein E4
MAARFAGKLPRGFVLLYCFLHLASCSNISDSELPAKPLKTTHLPDLHSKPATDRPLHVSNPKFRDVARELGLDFSFHADYTPERFFLPEVMGGGVGCLDYDRDGWIDLFFPNGSYLFPEESPPNSPPPVNGFYRNTGSGFESISANAGLDHSGYGQGVAIADYNADGFPDIFLANYGENILYCNQGDGTFLPAMPQPPGKQLWSTSPAWVDLNGDGWLDLYVVNYLNVTRETTHVCEYEGVMGYCGPGEYEALPDEVFLNLGNGEFEEASARLGLVAPDGKGLAVSVLDFDHDLKPEIYVANDMTANFLFSQTKLGTPDSSSKTLYKDLAAVSGCAVSESGKNEASMGVGCADFDFDQLPDIYLTHFYQQKNTFYHNRGNLMFYDDSRRFRVVTHSNDYLGFGVVPFDYNLDGAMDLFIANGHVLGPNFPISTMPAQLIANVEGKYFEDVSSKAGDYFALRTLGRGAASLDFDNDGDTDIAVSHLPHPCSLLQNETDTTACSILGLILEDRNRNSPIGGRVEVEGENYKRSYPIVSGGSYLSSPDPRLQIPLPPGDSTVRIYWTSGKVSEFAELNPGRYWYLREEFPPLSLIEFPISP